MKDRLKGYLIDSYKKLKGTYFIKERDKYMPTTISRIHNDAVIVTLPPHHGEQPDPNQEYVVVYTKDGTIILVPTAEYPFLESEKEMEMM